jgi:hypothetical protein
MTDKVTTINLKLTPEELQMLDDLRRHERDVPTRTTMARRLIRAAVRAPKTAEPARSDRWAAA